jgi:hypothetical protein
MAGTKKNVIIGVLVFLVVVLGSLSGWALHKYQQERTGVQQRIDEEVQKARQEQRRADEARFEQERKTPYKVYTAPSVYGSIAVSYPKSWSVYVEDDTSGNTNIDLFIHPDIIRRQGGRDRPLAFRMQLENGLFADVTDEYRNDVENGDLKANDVTISGIKGVRYEGNIQDEHQGSLVALPYRDRTILMWMESRDFSKEFNTILERVDITP